MTTKRTRIANFALCASLAAALVVGTGLATAADKDLWPGTRVGEPTPKIKGAPPALAKNLANFDDLDFRVYTSQQWQDWARMALVDTKVRVQYKKRRCQDGKDT